MSDLGSLGMAVLVGFLLGLVYFLGLWWTVRRAVRQRQSSLLVPLSWLVRSTIVVLGFVVVSGGDWRRLTACLLGFTTSRLLVTHRIGRVSHDERGERCT